MATDYSSPVGTKVRATASLGGWDNEECRGRPCDVIIKPGYEGVVIGQFDLPHGGHDNEDLIVDCVRFHTDEGTVFVGAVEGDHFEVLS